MAFDLSGLRVIRRELCALATAVASLRRGAGLADEGLEAKVPDCVPLVFVHGFLGDPTNFVVLRRFLRARGMGPFTAFRYRPRLDYPRLMGELATFIEDLLRTTGAPQVDLVGHSLGGLLARSVTERGHRTQVRRLVTLGAPSLTTARPPQELAVYAAADPIIPLPDAEHAARQRVRIVGGCGHLGLLYHRAVLGAVASFLASAGTIPETARSRGAPRIRRTSRREGGGRGRSSPGRAASLRRIRPLPRPERSRPQARDVAKSVEGCGGDTRADEEVAAAH